METPVRVPSKHSENFKDNAVSKPGITVNQAPAQVADASGEARDVKPPIMGAAPSMIADGAVQVPAEAAPEALEDWKLRLQQMLATGSPELFMQQSPALALLAGRLEFMEPAQIPAIVAQSPLLQSILGQGQTAEVLQTTMPLEQNLQMLGLLPQTLQAKPAGPISLTGMEGQTQQPLVTLGETLEALGFDTRRIVQEGDLLKDNLGLEGLQTYMQRAERMQSSLDLPVEWPTLPTVPAMVSPQQKSTMQTQASQALDPALMAQLSRLSPQNQPSLDTVQLWSQNPERPELLPLTVLDDGSSPIFLNPMDAATESWDPFAAATELQADPTLAPAPTMDEIPLVMNVLPRVPTATLDPFIAMAQRWDANTLQTMRPEDFVSRDSTEFTADAKNAAAHPLRSLDELINSQFIQAPDFNNRMDASSLPNQDAASFDVNSLQLSLQDLGSSSDAAGGDPSGRNQNQSFMNHDSNSMFAPTQSLGQSNQAFSIETAAGPQAPSSPVSQQQLQDIFDKSSMLIKDGGGSIRLDLGSNEMGPLDLALDIKDKTVELRIVAHSDQAREALAQELPKLREALQNQNLNLEKVEIGLSYGSWSQSSGNGQQNREQFFENTSESSSRGPNGVRSTSRSYRQSFVSAPETRVPLHNGLIQVRV
jgi:flagellar hook-length control protein FliK